MFSMPFQWLLQWLCCTLKFWWSRDCYVVNPQKYVFAFEVILSFIFSHFWTGMSCILCLNGHELCPLRKFSSVEKNQCSSFFLRVGCCLGIFLLQQRVYSFADSSFAQDLRFFLISDVSPCNILYNDIWSLSIFYQLFLIESNRMTSFFVRLDISFA